MTPSRSAQAVIDAYIEQHGGAFSLFHELPLQYGPPRQFDRKGEPITMREWVILHSVLEYVRVAWDEVGPYHVSTVWLGLNHNWAGGTPIIFESMVFASETSVSKEIETEWGTLPSVAYHESFNQRRYSTEDEAHAGHAQLVEDVRATWEATRHIDPRLLPPREHE